MKSNGIGCLGGIVIVGAIFGAIASFTNGNIGLGWVSVIVACLVPFVFGNAMLRANTKQFGAASNWGQIAVRETKQAMAARNQQNYLRSEESWIRAMNAAPRAAAAHDWVRVVLVSHMRYVTLKADERYDEAFRLMTTLKALIPSFPQEMREELVQMLSDAEGLTSDECEEFANGTDWEDVRI